jgi:hypothetical protein
MAGFGISGIESSGSAVRELQSSSPCDCDDGIMVSTGANS